MSALPHFSDVDLLRYGKRIIDLDTKIADGTHRALSCRLTPISRPSSETLTRKLLGDIRLNYSARNSDGD